MKQNLLGLFIASIVLVACQKNDVSRSQNESANNLNVERSDSRPGDNVKSLNALDFQKLADNSIHLKDPTALLRLIQDLSIFVLNKNFVEDPNVRLGTSMRALLGDFNQAVLRLQQLTPSSPDLNDILKKYREIAFSGCDSQSLKNCKNLSFFSADFRSIDLLILRVRVLDYQIMTQQKGQSCVANCNAEISEYYRILALISDMKNLEKRTDIEFLYLKHARDYANVLLSETKSGENPPKSVRDKLGEHASYFESLISKYEGDAKNPGFKDFVSNFKPWTYSRIKPDIFPYGAEKMFKYASENFLYIEDQNKKMVLNPDLIEAIHSTQINAEKAKKIDHAAPVELENLKNDPTFSELVAYLKIKNPKIFEAFSLDPEAIHSQSFMDEYFFIVDRLYRGHINSEEAQEIWKGSHQDKKKLLSTIEYYAKIQVLSLIQRTNEVIKLIYQQKFEQLNILVKVLSDSSQLSSSWSEMLGKIDQMNTFISALFEKAGDDEEYYHSSLLLKSVKTNIKYLAVYPQMLVLNYFVSSLNTDVINPMSSGPGDRFMRPDKVIVDFFNARTRPQFLFGNDVNYPLSKVGIIFSYHFANLTGALDTYNPTEQTEDIRAFDQKALFEKVIAKYLSEEKSKIDSEIEGLRDTLPSNSDFASVLEYCQHLRLDKSTGRIAGDLIVSLDMQDLEKYTTFGNYAAGKVSSFQNFYNKNTGSSRFDDRLRIDFDRKLIRIKAMVQILEQDKAFISAKDESQKQKMIQEIKSELDVLQGLENVYFELALNLQRRVGQCDTLMARTELQNDYDIFKSEAQYLGKIYDVYSSNDPAVIIPNAVLEKANKDFMLDNPDLDAFQPQGYRYSKYGLLQRIAKHLAQMNPKVIVNAVADPRALSYYSTSVNLPYKNSEGKLLTKDEFIGIGMKKLNGANAFLNWRDNFSVLPRKNKIEAMVALYKLGAYLDQPQRLTADEIISEVLDMLDAINITDDDLPVMNWLGISNKLGGGPGGRVLDLLEDITSKNTLRSELLDAVFDQISTDPVAASDLQDPNAPAAILNQDVFNNVLDDGVNLIGTLTSFEEFLLSPDNDKKIEFILRKLYQPAIARSLSLISEFRTAVTVRENKLGSKELKYRLDLGSHNTYSVNLVSGVPVLLSRNKLKGYDDTMYDFTEAKTCHAFDNPYTDPKSEYPKCK